MSALRKGKNKSIRLQAAWNKYGEDSFRFELLEVVDNPTYLLIIEQAWMDYFDVCNESHGLNMQPNAGSCYGSVKSFDARRRISLALKGRSSPLKGRSKSKESIERQAHSRSRNWIVISPDGIEHRIRNLNAFCRLKGLNSGKMILVAQGVRNTHAGWKCRKDVE